MQPSSAKVAEEACLPDQSGDGTFRVFYGRSAPVLRQFSTSSTT